MTKERIELTRSIGEGHGKLVMLAALKECLDEIVRLNKQREMVVLVFGSEDCKDPQCQRCEKVRQILSTLQ